MEPPVSQRSFEPADLVGTVLADTLRVGRLLSSGANVAIYDAVDESSGRLVTLKLIRPKLSASPSFRRQFEATMRGAAALSHPNIAAVYDWGMAPIGDISTAYVVNEHLDGGSLRDLFDRGRRLSPSQALGIGLDVCRALDHAHRRGFVHAELNPAKIVFGDDRRLRVIDFGLARLLGAPAWEQPDSVPTHVAWYAAPEQGLGLAVDGRADVYALCLTLHEAVTGAVPFKSDSTVAALTARVGKLMPVSADLGPLAAVLERAGRPDAEDRSTAAEFGKGLLSAAAKLPRPEPLPLLSSSLFETPPDQLRSPTDPTGGVARPGAIEIVPIDAPAPAFDAADQVSGVPVEGAVSDPAAQQLTPVADGALPDVPPDDLVILTLDAEQPGPTRPGSAQAGAGEPGEPTPESDVGSESAASAGPAPAPRRRRRMPWKWVWGALVVAALVGLGVLSTRLFQRPTHVVPALVGLPEAEAENLIAANAWEVEIESERSDEQPVRGAVIRTVPSESVELAEGERFVIVVSDGPLLRTLPESTGSSLAAAQTALVELALDVRVVEQYDEVVAAGVVIAWAVPGDATLVAGSKVEPATPVELVVSRGPEPRTVPNLIGSDLAGATATLQELALTLVEVGREHSDDITIGAVMRQNIAEGTAVERGSAVEVVVSLGPDLVTFPDLSTAATYQQAADLLVQAGFQPVLIFGDAEGALRSITIDGDTPEVGTTWRRGTTVEIEAL